MISGEFALRSGQDYQMLWFQKVLSQDVRLQGGYWYKAILGAIASTSLRVGEKGKKRKHELVSSKRDCKEWVMQGKDDRSIGELIAELSRETVALVRQEVQLAKAEMSQKASRVGKNVGFLIVGGVVAYTGLLAIVAAVIIVLGGVIPLWLSALVVGLVIAAIGLFLVVKGANTLRQEDPAPQETIETLKEDREWLRDQTR
jgi:uncharacterized membrane protein YqjE